MRVLVSTTAGEGHFGPLVPFAHALVAAGHEVRVAAPASFAQAVERAGLAHVPFADAPPDELGRVFARLPQLARLDANRTMIREVFGTINSCSALPGLRQMVDDWQPQLILREQAEFGSVVVAAERRIPHVQVAIGVTAVDEFFLPLVEDPLRELGCADGTATIRAAPRLTLVPETFDTPPMSDTGPTARFRYGNRAEEAAALPPWWPHDALPLVYVSFGSVAARLGRFADVYRQAIDALADAPVRVLLTVGEGGDPDGFGKLPDNVHVEKWWPQQDVMAHAAAVVGHGGFGTTMYGLTAGVPMVVVPLFSSDQFINAERVQDVGAGVALSGAEDIAGLGDAVQRVVAEPSFAAAANALADEIADLPRPDAAVPMFELVVAEHD